MLRCCEYRSKSPAWNRSRIAPPARSDKILQISKKRRGALKLKSLYAGMLKCKDRTLVFTYISPKGSRPLSRMCIWFICLFLVASHSKLSGEGLTASPPWIGGAKVQRRPTCQQIQTKGGWTAQKPCSLYDLCHLHNPATPGRFYLRLFFSSGGTSWLYN